MEIADANIILRYLLNDQKAMSEKAGKILENNAIHLPFEVCAEVVYVLEKVYAVPRTNIYNSLNLLINYPNISTTFKMVLIESLKIYSTENIDFVDAILVAYHRALGATIHTFDKKLKRLCK